MDRELDAYDIEKALSAQLDRVEGLIKDNAARLEDYGGLIRLTKSRDTLKLLISALQE